MGLIAKVRNFSRHDVIIIAGNKYVKDKWTKIDDGLSHEELTIIDEKAVKSKRKHKEVNYD